MNKKFAAIGIATLVLTSCMTSAQARVIEKPINNIKISMPENSPSLIDEIIVQKEFTARALTLSKNTKDLNDAMTKVKKHVNKTWYVFSGSTPSGWDCSGLVRWTYEHLGIELYHSATAQIASGRIVSEPKYGDIVGFQYFGSQRYYHVGIYISENLMLHSGGKKGDRTELRSISDFAGDYSRVVYSRIVDTH
jgi:cell wall-associated NlpC family hydrolase